MIPLIPRSATGPTAFYASRTMNPGVHIRNRAPRAMSCFVAVALPLLMGCSSTEHRGSKDTSTSPYFDAQLSRAGADSVIATYLRLSTEGDRDDVDSLERLRKKSGPCLEEQVGDGVASYWLALGRLIGYEGRDVDTLKARLEIVTVAEQVPSTTTATGSVVTARLRTDTVVMRLVPDDSRTRWQVCGYLSTGFDFGGYGSPDNVHFNPSSITRAHLLRQVDSIQRSPHQSP